MLIEPSTRNEVNEDGETVTKLVEPVSIERNQENEELVLYFEYKAVTKSLTQDKLVESAIETIIANQKVQNTWADILERAPTEKKPHRTILEKHLSVYTQRNSADYFIHKDLGGFLSNELDFYIKNEVMNLDNVQNAEVFSDIEKQLRMIQCLRSIATDIVTFLAQLENFQKKLWIKKKFVTETSYIVSLELVPESFYQPIVENIEQISEWNELFDFELEPESVTPEFLAKNPNLLIDTSNFSSSFKEKLISNIRELDSQINGRLFHGDNFHALRLIKNKFAGKIKCVYLDPPYNTAVSAIPYKNAYKHSSWATMMENRLSWVQQTMTDASACYVSIDKNERDSLVAAMDKAFGKDNKVEELIWVQNTNDGRAKTFSTNHEYVEVYSKNLNSAEEDLLMFREPKPGFEEVMHLIAEINPNYPSIAEIEEQLKTLYKTHKDDYKKFVEEQGWSWEQEKKNDPWKGTYAYKSAEYRDGNGKYVEENLAKEVAAKIWVYSESDWTIMESDQKQSTTTKDPNHPNYRYYQPIHPLTGKPCNMPSRGWKGTRFIDPKYPDRNSLESLMDDHRIEFGSNEKKVPRQKKFLHEVDTNVAKSIIVDYSDGEKETTNLFGRKGVFLAPKHTQFVSRFVRQATLNNSYVLDIFGGSGSTAGAVIESNRIDGYNRKFILMETNTYIDSTIIPRIKKTAYCSKWKEGKPQSIDGVPLFVKFQRLESYEDALNNLEFKRPQTTGDLFDSMPEQAKSDYLLNYMLETESKGSLLSTDDFKKPFDYKMKIAVDSAGAFEERNIDLVETFNYLVGLHVNTVESNIERGYVRVEGNLPSGEKALVLWRDCEKIGYDDFTKFANRFDLFAKEKTFDVIYVNGDHNLPTAFTSDEGEVTRTLKLRQIEPEFLELMFAPDELA